MKSSSPKTEVLSYVEHLNGLVQAPGLGLLVYDQVNIHIGMDEVSVCGPPDSPLDAHQAVLLGPGQHGPRVQD